MFTGIVEEIGIVRAIKNGSNSAVLTIEGDIIFSDIKLGDSIAVNGVCLTVSGFKDNSFSADVMNESLKKSSLGKLKPASHVNLERAMPANGRFGGHIVSGHIDGIGEIQSVTRDDNAIWYSISTSEEIMHYIVEKGSITIDGISLTVVDVGQKNFNVSIIPHTAASTILAEKKVNDTVNLENDILGKYIEKLINKNHGSKSESKITKDFLNKFGY